MNPSKSNITLYGVHLSGHVHRVEMLLDMLGLSFTFKEAPADERNSDEFRKMNPLGQIPVLTDGDLVLCDSNAILVYLVKRYASNSAWLPADPVGAAQVQRWLSIAAGEIKYGPAAARVALQWGQADDAQPAGTIADKLLDFMNAHLQGRRFLAMEQETLADLACNSYIAHAPEGGISLTAFPEVRAWLTRVEALPNFKPMPQLPIKVAA
jgi:glutathione S-transferase